MVYAEPKRANRPTFSQPRPLSVPSNCAEAATTPSTRLPAAIAATNRSAPERSSGRLMTQRADATRRAKTPKARRPRVPAWSVAAPYICSNWLGSTKNPVPNPTRTTEWTANRGWRLTDLTLSYKQPTSGSARSRTPVLTTVRGYPLADRSAHIEASLCQGGVFGRVGWGRCYRPGCRFGGGPGCEWKSR